MKKRKGKKKGSDIPAIAAIGITIALLCLLALAYLGMPGEEPGEEPPYSYNPLEEVQEEFAESPGNESEIMECEPPSMSDYCLNGTRYYDFECENGEWKFSEEKCAYECREGGCVNTGCPPCEDGNPCTLDMCSGGPLYECLHVVMESCTVEPEEGKACVPVAGPGSWVRIDIYPPGASSTHSRNPEMFQVVEPGETIWIDSDDYIRLEGFQLEGSCPQCFEPPILKWPPYAKIRVGKDLSGETTSSYIAEGESGYICTEGTCIEQALGGCREYKCNTSRRFTVSELYAVLTCS